MGYTFELKTGSGRPGIGPEKADLIVSLYQSGKLNSVLLCVQIARRSRRKGG